MTDVPCCNTGAIGKRWHLEPFWRTPLSPSHFFLVFWSSSTSHPLPVSHSSQPPPLLGFPFTLLGTPTPPGLQFFCKLPLPLGLPLCFGLPTHLWPPGVPPSLSGLPSHYSVSYPPPASNPFSASQPFPNSHSSFWPDTLIFGWTPSFYSWTLLLHPFLKPSSF